MSTELLTTARAACRAGWFEPAVLSALTRGRINDTLRVGDGQQRQFVLQRVSATVFPEPDRLMAQVARIADHLATQAPGLSPGLVATRGNAHCLTLTESERPCYWRLWHYVPGEPLVGGDGRLTLTRLRATGAAFGRLQVCLETLPGAALQPAIPHYHDFDFQLRCFDSLPAPARRAAGRDWNARVDRFRELAATIGPADGHLHGDCKPDNVLFAIGGSQVAALLDLDTVMWGHRALDFGDLIRSAVWRDERFDSARFEALAVGFVQAQGQGEAPSSVQSLLAAPRYVSAMLSLRYLIDHLSGDRQFKVERHGDNLERAERQHRRTNGLIAAESEMAQRLEHILAP